MLEKYGIENAEELDLLLDKNDNLLLSNGVRLLKERNDRLEQELAELKHKLKVAEIALNKMSNYAINDNNLYDLVSDFNIENERYDEDHLGIDARDVADYFKEQAEKEIKGE